jgi:hypothetical protein
MSPYLAQPKNSRAISAQRKANADAMLSANPADLNRPLRRLIPNTPGSLRSANTANIAGSTCTSTRTLTKDRQENYISITFAAVLMCWLSLLRRPL